MVRFFKGHTSKTQAVKQTLMCSVSCLYPIVGHSRPRRQKLLISQVLRKNSRQHSASFADPRAGGLLRQTTQKMLRRPGATEGGKPPPQKTPSQRRMQRPQQPPSPGSDTEPEPPVNRQAARPIFGGIAKMVRNPSGRLLAASLFGWASPGNGLGLMQGLNACFHDFAWPGFL